MMNLSPISILACFAVFLSAGSSLAACPADDPVASAKGFYSAHRSFYMEEPSKIKNLASPRLLAVLEKEFKCSNGEICAIEADPWMDAQDGGIGTPIAFSLVSNSGLLAKVQMTYTFVQSKTQRRKQHVTLLLQRNSPSDCWLIGDLVGPRGSSLVTTLEKWHKEFGSGL